MLEPRNLANTRFYIYRSQNKIEMLADSLFRQAKSRKGSVGIKTGVLNASIEMRGADDATLIDKLLRIEQELEEQHLIGTIDEPRDYVRGTVRMRVGLFDDGGKRPDGSAPLVFFGGVDTDGPPVIVGLGGSSSNLERFNGMSSTWSRSSTDVIAKWLLSGVQNDAPPRLPDWWDMEDENRRLCDAVAIALHNLRPPTQRLEFFAKTLMLGKHGSGVIDRFAGIKGDARFVLGTPLYVSQAGLTPDDRDGWGLDSEWSREVD